MPESLEWWLIPPRIRHLIHALTAPIVAVLLSLSVVTEDQANAWITAVASLLTAVQALVAIVHLSPEGRPDVRAAIYGLSAAASTVLGTYGVFVSQAVWQAVVQVIVTIVSALTAESHVSDKVPSR